MSETITQLNYNDNNPEISDNHVEFGVQASQELRNLRKPYQNRILSEENGGIAYAPRDSSEEELYEAAAAFALTALGGTETSITDNPAMYLEGYYGAIFADPELVRQSMENFTASQALLNGRSTDQLTESERKQYNDLADLHTELTRQNINVIRENIAKAAAIESEGDDQMLSPTEMAYAILEYDKNNNGIIENNEDRELSQEESDETPKFPGISSENIAVHHVEDIGSPANIQSSSLSEITRTRG